MSWRAGAKTATLCEDINPAPVEKVRHKAETWLEPVLCVLFSALTLMVEWQERDRKLFH